MLKFRQVCFRLSARKGQTMTEYALLLAGVAAIAMAGYNGLGASANTAMTSASQLLAVSGGTNAGGGTAGGGGAASGGSGGADGGGSGGGSGSGHHHHHHHFFF